MKYTYKRFIGCSFVATGSSFPIYRSTLLVTKMEGATEPCRWKEGIKKITDRHWSYKIILYFFPHSVI